MNIVVVAWSFGAGATKTGLGDPKMPRLLLGPDVGEALVRTSILDSRLL